MPYRWTTDDHAVGLVCVQWRTYGSKSGGRQGGAPNCRSLEVRRRGGGVLDEGVCPFSPAWRPGERCKLPQWGPGRSSGDLAIFVDFSTQEVILGAIQSESSRLYPVQNYK